MRHDAVAAHIDARGLQRTVRHFVGAHDGDTASTTKNIQSQSLIAGKLLIHVLGTTLSGIKFEPQKAAAAVNAVRQIWPFQREFLWPPLYAVSDTQASLIASELDRCTVRLPFVGGR
ncbi:MAG: hypothetical protein ACLPTZ_06625 [Beijerinckiaceae bacterium]